LPADRVDLSVVIPAYNESHRLPPYLALVRRYLEAGYPDRYEVIVVDDGSQDGLANVLAQAGADWPQLRSIAHPENQGKGAAVRTGVLASQGRLVLFADADGATPIEEERRLAEAIARGADVAVGSRLLAAPGVHRSRAWARGLAGRLFAAVARRLLGLSIRDTQCGFKMFRAEPARRLFSLAREPRYLFDLEILALAVRLGYRIEEVPVNWREVPGGHLHLARELPKVAGDLWRIRRRLREQIIPDRL
jgi:dolichyl-phosphate beta-glucosyltransferase